MTRWIDDLGFNDIPLGRISSIVSPWVVWKNDAPSDRAKRYSHLFILRCLSSVRESERARIMMRVSSLLSPLLCQSPPSGQYLASWHTRSLSLSLPRPLESPHTLSPLSISALSQMLVLSRALTLCALSIGCALWPGRARKLSTPNNSAWKNASDLYWFTGNARVFGPFSGVFSLFFDHFRVLLVVFDRLLAEKKRCYSWYWWRESM